jgi:fatty acyl-CoA reductase
VIWRPAIIASSISDPFPGWTDQLSAAGGVTILGGLGFVPYLYGSGLNTVDLVPVDIVVNGLLAATCHGARSDTEQLHVYNCGTSVQNPINLYDYKETMLKYYRHLKLNEQQFTVDLQTIGSKTEFKLKKKIFEDLPINMLDFVSKLPIVGTPALKNAAEKLKKMSKKINSMIEVFDFFIRGDWHYENKKVYEIIKMMSPSEQLEFHCDCK